MNTKRILTILLAATFAVTGGRVGAQSQPSYSLEDLRQMATANSRDLLIAQEKVKSAEQMRKAAFTQFFPNFSANAAYTWNEKGISLLGADALLPVGTKMSDGSFGFTQEQISNKWTVVNGQPVPLDSNGKPFNPKTDPDKIMWKDYAYLPKEAMEFDTKNLFVANVGFVQPIFMGNKIREIYRIAKHSEQIAKIRNQKVSEDLMVAVDEAYWRTISLSYKQKLAEKYVELMKKLNYDVEAMLEEGVATKGDLLNVRVKLNQANVTLSKVENGISLSKMALAQLCGIGVEQSYSLVDESIDQPSSSDYSFNVDDALSRRSEIQLLQEMSNIAHSTVNLNRSRFMPNLVGTANYIVSNPNVYNGFSNKFGGMFSVGVALNVPIFHFGDKIHTLKAAKHTEQVAKYEVQKASEMVELQLNQLSFKLIEANKQLETANSNITSAEENLRLAATAYEEGVINITQYMEAQTAWVMAQSEKIDAGIEVKMCQVYFNNAKGITE